MTKPTVLIVEDDMSIALEAEILILEAGVLPIGHASAVPDARALALRFRPCIALIGLSTAAPEVLALARELSGKLGTRVVLASDGSATLPEDLAGAVGVLRKPFSPDSFRAAMTYVQDVIDGVPARAPPGLILPRAPVRGAAKGDKRLAMS